MLSTKQWWKPLWFWLFSIYWGNVTISPIWNELEKNSWKEESCKRTKREYWYGIIATLELKDLITTSEDASLMTLLNNSNILQILQISVSNELEEFYWKLNSCYRLLILLSMTVMDPIIYNSSFGFSLQGQW